MDALDIILRWSFLPCLIPSENKWELLLGHTFVYLLIGHIATKWKVGDIKSLNLHVISDLGTLWGLCMMVVLLGASVWLWHFLAPVFDCDTSWDLHDSDTSCRLFLIVTLHGASMIVTLHVASMIVTLLGVTYDCGTSWGYLWLWHFLWSNYVCDISLGLYDYGTSWGLPMILTFSGATLWLWLFLGPLYYCDTFWSLYDCEASWGLTKTVKIPCVSVWLWLPGASLRLWHFLGHIYYFNTSWSLYDWYTALGISLIVALPVASLELWHFLGLYDCGTSWASLIVTFPAASLWL